MYYRVRQVLKRLQVPLPYESEFNVSDNPYISEGFSRCARTTTFLMILQGIEMKDSIEHTNIVWPGPVTT